MAHLVNSVIDFYGWESLEAILFYLYEYLFTFGACRHAGHEQAHISAGWAVWSAGLTLAQSLSSLWYHDLEHHSKDA
jgi:hypothetical protein